MKGESVRSQASSAAAARTPTGSRSGSKRPSAMAALRSMWKFTRTPLPAASTDAGGGGGATVMYDGRDQWQRAALRGLVDQVHG